jgi:cytochrome P450
MQTVSAFWSLFLGMALHPESLRKAQQELDDVCQDRLPEFSDRPSLPYVTAVVQEVLRWHPVTPLGFAHRLMVDDVYNGMLMPAGSTVIGNTW